MNTALSTFLKFGITALAIGILLFGVGYNLMSDQANTYSGHVTSVEADLPSK
ncbi:hypothetical protein [Terribacillus sp. DMT04]|uniref:hypothetical protein n=1 Tax=Terribacillus sp. DMT04 TaxID=2850441 RepID=UPI001C2C5D81|nr:hypothetical protein [Terribacillus sp. DMT04]QXE03538.1 hypothetical protein KS242_17840 [Terribacillus sp. DMT04]